MSSRKSLANVPSLDVVQDLAHGRARLLRDDLRAGDVVAVFGAVFEIE